MAGQGRGGNEGFSGTPMWKIQQQMAQYRDSVMASKQAELNVVAEVPPEQPHVLVDTSSVGGPNGGVLKFVRTVLVRDLNKVASRLKIDLPKTNVFKDKAPVGLYALFDGQSCAGEPGVKATEFCARNFHLKVLENLSQLPPNHATETFVKAALIKSFEDLDGDLMKTQPDIQDGCGAALVLLVGEIAFTAVLGRCNVVLCESEQGACKAVSLGGNQREITSQEERLRLRQVGAGVMGDGPMARLRHPSGALSFVGRSLGDPQWKGAVPVISCCPEVASTTLRGAECHPFMVVLASSVASVLDPKDVVDLANQYYMKPKAASGEICAHMLEIAPSGTSETQYSAVGVCFLPPVVKDEVPSAKKAKLASTAKAIGGITSVRLRHILVKFVDSSAPQATVGVNIHGQATVGQARQVDAKGRPVKRTREEAETLLRRAIVEQAKDIRAQKKTPKDVAERVSMESKKFAELCREMSDCPTAQKGGAMCGDLGWMPQDQLVMMGGNFKANIDALTPGMWSDITQSKEGLHLIQKVA